MTNDVVTNLPPGKVAQSGFRQGIKAQRSMTCTLYGIRRIGIYNSEKIEHKKYFTMLKNVLSEFKGQHDDLVKTAFLICSETAIDLEVELAKDEFFKNLISKQPMKMTKVEFLQKLPLSSQWLILYNILSEKIIFPLLNLKSSNWHPRDGLESLKSCLKKDGPHAFLGKFGCVFYGGKVVKSEKESTRKEIAYFFDKKAYRGDDIPFTHCVVVDRVKYINNVPMVCFRDPATKSVPGKKEHIFMLSYTSFIDRLADWEGRRFKNNSGINKNFGVVSTDLEKLISAPRSPNSI